MDKSTDIFDCSGKVVAITGGSGLIGKELAYGFLQNGAKVCIADIKSPVPDIRNTEFVKIDITSERSVVNGFKKLKNKYGCIDVLVNTAYPATKDWSDRFEKVRFSSFIENISGHLGGYFLTSRYAAEMMKKQNKGSIINFSSIYAFKAPDFSIYDGTSMTMPAAYAPIKAGVIAFTRYIASYYGKHNVRANIISPGGVYNNQPESFVKKYEKKTPLSRMALPGDIVGAAVFLASDASSYITGSNIVVDGGWSL